jgi:single-stranded DNA-binding protein
MSALEVAFFGAVARDAELKTSKAGKAYLRFTCRVGENDPSWVSTMYFGDDAPELGPRLTRGVRCYVEGSLKLDRWDKEGVSQSGLSCMSFHCRVAAIGRRKPTRRKPEAAVKSAAPKSNNFYSDEIGF